MNTVERVTSFTELVTASFENAMGTMERVHQASVDLSVALFSQLGFWQDEAERYRQGHAKMVHTVYGSIVEVNNEFGSMIVGQAENLSKFMRSVTGAEVNQKIRPSS
jgi:hypothetical protein